MTSFLRSDRSRPVAIWLFVAFLVALVHPFFASSRWLVVHLVVLGVVTHSAMVWSVHVTDALLKTKATVYDVSSPSHPATR